MIEPSRINRVVTTQIYRQQILSFLGLSLKALKRLFSLQPMWDITIRPFRGPASSLTLVPFSNRCGTSFEPSVLTVTLPRVYPFGEQQEGWHIVRCLALISFVTTQIHRQQILSFLNFPFQASPFVGGRFSYRQGVLFSFPTNMGHHKNNLRQNSISPVALNKGHSVDLDMKHACLELVEFMFNLVQNHL